MYDGKEFERTFCQWNSFIKSKLISDEGLVMQVFTNVSSKRSVRS